MINKCYDCGNTFTNKQLFLDRPNMLTYCKGCRPKLYEVYNRAKLQDENRGKYQSRTFQPLHVKLTGPRAFYLSRFMEHYEVTDPRLALSLVIDSLMEFLPHEDLIPSERRKKWENPTVRLETPPREELKKYQDVKDVPKDDEEDEDVFML